jgi:hypothetical protein
MNFLLDFCLKLPLLLCPVAMPESLLIAGHFIYFRTLPPSPASSPPASLVPVLREGIETSVSRKWRSVDMSSVAGMGGCNIEVDESEFSAPTMGRPDPIVPFFEKLSQFMHETGGAIPAIVNNTLPADWRSKLEELVMNPLNDSEDEDTSLTKTFEILRGKKIRIFGKNAPYVSSDAEGSAVWSLESGEFVSGNPTPDLDKAVLYIFIKDFHAVKDTVGQDSLAFISLGRIRTLIHELVHGMRFMKRLIACFGTLNWSQNQYRDWCIGKNQFITEIVTPPKLGPNPTASKELSGYPADAGRTWEHSITQGQAIFQRNFEVITSVNGKFRTSHVSNDQAIQVLRQPSEIIRLSRELATKVAAYGRIDLYPTNSELIQEVEYQCEGSGGWVLGHLEQLHSWRTKGGSDSKHPEPC